MAGFQEYFVRALDDMSYFYMGFQKSGPEVAAATDSIEEYIARNNADDPLEYFKNPGVVPEMEFFNPMRRNRYNLTDFRFTSPVYSQHRTNNIVRGRYYERHGEPDAPLVTLLHGWRMDSYIFFDRYARLLVRAGFNVAMPDLPYHMSRTPRHSFAGEHTFKDDAIHTMETFRQALFDVMSVMNWAREKKKARATGTMGVSFGGLLSGLLACVDPHVFFAVMIAPPSDLGEIFKTSRLGRLFEKENPRASRLVERYRETLALMALTNQKPFPPPERIFIAEGLYDGMVPPEIIDKLWHTWDHPHLERYPHGHLSVILFNPELEESLKEWLAGIYKAISG
jgi:pimeloyl-ACP methyl ester carboxylesterase